MLKSFFKLFKKQKSIAFLDGDQPLVRVVHAYNKHLKNVETHLVAAFAPNTNEPHILRDITTVNKIYLRGYRARKETTDKFIGARIQKAVSEGYTDITVVSADYDFIDIFKMVSIINNTKNLTFKLIVCMHEDRIEKYQETATTNIQIINAALPKRA